MKVGTKCKFSHHFVFQKIHGHSKHCSVKYLGESLSHWYWALPTFAEQQVGTSLHSGSCRWKGAPESCYESLHDASCVYEFIRVHSEFIASNEKSLVVTWCARICRTSLQIRRKTCSKDTMENLFPSDSIDSIPRLNAGHCRATTVQRSRQWLGS